MKTVTDRVHFGNQETMIRDAAYALDFQASLDYILDGLISRGSVNVLYGDPGIGKTYSLLSLACCIAIGKPWCGLKTKPVRCMIVDEESGETRLSLRLKAVLKSMSAYGDTQLIYISLGGVDLDETEHVKKLEQIIKENDIGFIVFDALSDLMTGNENEKHNVQPIMTNLRWIAENTGAAIALIHHSSKGGDYRGSSAIKGSCDTMTHMISTNKGKLLPFEITKARDFEPIAWYAKPVWTKNAAGENIFYLVQATKSDVIPEKARGKNSKKVNPIDDQILAYLTEIGKSAVHEITVAVDPEQEDKVRRRIYNLSNKGLVHRTNPGERIGVDAIYDLGPTPDIPASQPNEHAG